MTIIKISKQIKLTITKTASQTQYRFTKKLQITLDNTENYKNSPRKNNTLNNESNH